MFMVGTSVAKCLTKRFSPQIIIIKKKNKPKLRSYCHFIHSTEKSDKLLEDYRTGFWPIFIYICTLDFFHQHEHIFKDFSVPSQEFKGCYFLAATWGLLE